MIELAEVIETKPLTKEATTIQVHNTITENAKTASQEMRHVKKLVIGTGIRQGDVYMVRINPEGATKIKTLKDQQDLIVKIEDYDKVETTNRQLAPGTSKGSRHIITAGPKVYNFLNTRLVLNGPLVIAASEFVLTHPEHAHYRLPAGTYAVFFQGDHGGVSAKEKTRRDEMMRALD